ncbi:MAG: DUF3084 domain-containing protein [Candidatus Saganbacteria bacterium]|nr:DUF3084 domain-containing protein [Candidatus Saganbacteria bacterium]
MFAIQIIVVIIFVSGLIAYIGNIVGRSIGKKRLTAFNLRPRHTATAITVITGSLIALTTGVILFLASADVRTALFGLDGLKKMISERSIELEKIKADRQALLSDISILKNTLDASKKDVLSLTKTKENLSKEIRTARSGLLLFKVNDVILSTVIDSSGRPELCRDKLGSILAETDSIIKSNVKGDKKHYILMPSSELDEAVNFMAAHPGSTIVRVVAAGNVILGEEIPVHFELFENALIFKKGETILRSEVDGRQPLPAIEQKIKETLSQVNETAISKRMVPNIDGSVGNIPYSKIFDASKNIRSMNRTVILSVDTSKDIYSAGPLEINLKITK